MLDQGRPELEGRSPVNGIVEHDRSER